MNFKQVIVSLLLLYNLQALCAMESQNGYYDISKQLRANLRKKGALRFKQTEERKLEKHSQQPGISEEKLAEIACKREQLLNDYNNHLQLEDAILQKNKKLIKELSKKENQYHCEPDLILSDIAQPKKILQDKYVRVDKPSAAIDEDYVVIENEDKNYIAINKIKK